MRLLRQGPFALLWTGTALNAMGSWAAIIAIWGFESSHFHASANQLALLGLAWTAPAALVGPLIAVAFVGVAAWGVDVAFFLPPMQVVLQRATPAAAHGRILALASTADGVANVVAIPLVGACVGLFGVRGSGAIVGVIAIEAGLAGMFADRSAATAHRQGLATGGVPGGPGPLAPQTGWQTGDTATPRNAS